MLKKTKVSAMESEIFEQPQILRSIFSNYVRDDDYIDLDVPRDIRKIVLVASGSSYHCARFAADLFGQIAQIGARAIYSSEFLLKSEIPHDPNTLYIFITQSGETTDTNKALLRAKEYNLQTCAVTNKKDSTIWNAADYKIDCQAGEEKSIAATKSLNAQLLCLMLLVLKYASFKGLDVNNYLDEMASHNIEDVFELRPEIKKAAKFLSKAPSIAVVADGISYALAKETALKIKETSYINANAMILGEFMHGHVAVLNNKKIPLIYIETDDISHKAMKNLNKISADYNPSIIVIGNANLNVKTKFNLNVRCESVMMHTFYITVIMQLLALEIALRLRRDIDKPKGLNKIVT